MTIKNLDLTEGISEASYFFSKMHRFLAKDASKSVGPNIGIDGSNLTISFLSFNRHNLSERLLRSMQLQIPGFKGEVLIIDNGSDKSTIKHLQKICALMPYKTKIIELGQNYGPGVGRNRTIPYVTTDWLMCLDNDIYFITNPFPQIQEDLAVFGAHFMSLPLLDSDKETNFALGAHIFLHYDGADLCIGNGGCFQKSFHKGNMDAFFGSFLFGGACVFNKKTFEMLGGYDERLFVGFEDLDFSIQLFQSGFKILCSGFFALVHDQEIESKEISSIEYRKIRYSRDSIYQSAKYLEAKYGFKVWTNSVMEYLDKQYKVKGEVGNHKSTMLLPKEEAHEKSKIKIALIIDVEDWAFANIARQLQNYLSDEFDFFVIPTTVIDNINQIFMLARECQIVHFFWRESLLMIGSKYFQSHVESLGISQSEFEKTFILSKHITTSIYDHLFLDKESIQHRQNLFRERISGYSVSSKKLNEIYSDISSYPKPLVVTQDGIDLNIFKPINIDRLNEISNRELIIGWVGNSMWSSHLEDFKGLHTILNPAIERLKLQGFKISTYYADTQERFIPHDQMAEYYSKIDVLICVSKIEGTPNPILEAMACGVPVITNDVGIVREAFGELQSEFILPSRSINSLCIMIINFLNNPELASKLSLENVEKIQKWDWKIQAEKFRTFFKKILTKDLEDKKVENVRRKQ